MIVARGAARNLFLAGPRPDSYSVPIAQRQQLKRKWSVRPADPPAADALARKTGVSPVTAQILLNRGIADAAAARDFLRIDIAQLRDPYEIPGMQAAVDRLDHAIRRGERIGIYGDYDVDGVSGTALLTRYFRLHETDAPAYIPHRTQEGYGLNAVGLQALADQGVRLLVTVDTGTTAHAEIARARELGMDVVVLDHHVPDATLPDGATVVNPMLGDVPNPLASVGIAFKTAWALAHRCEEDKQRFAEFLPSALTLAALGTVADVCPLAGDNRVLVALGLHELTERPSVGLAAIRRAAGMDEREIGAGDIAFKFAPRLNAAGRMLDARLALELLLTADESRAGQLAAELEMANRKRQKVEDQILREAVERIEAEGHADERVIVLADDRWHSGVVGIVAARLVERYARPVFLIGLDGDAGRGSARTIDGFNLKLAIAACERHLISGGGHEKAGGLSIARDRVDAFTEQMRAVARETLADEDLAQTVKIDMEVRIEEILPGLFREIARLAPFGIGNPRPVFCARGVRVAGVPRVMGRDGKHLQFFAAQDQASLRAVGWKMAELYESLLDAETVDLAFTVQENRWQGRVNLELELKDVLVRP